ncbi:MAG: hypothetical protein ACXVH3_38855 [Solirubrobacteraceae bacterium]
MCRTGSQSGDHPAAIVRMARRDSRAGSIAPPALVYGDVALVNGE